MSQVSWGFGMRRMVGRETQYYFSHLTTHHMVRSQATWLVATYQYDPVPGIALNQCHV